MNYVVHPGNGKISPSAPITYIDAGTLAALYGLSPSDYTVSNSFDPSSIHLTPKSDGRYRNIKQELGDNGTPTHQDYPAFMHVSRDGKIKDMHTIQPQYKDSFRDRRGRNETKVL